MSESALEAPRVHRGLKDVYFDRSSVSSIDGRAGELRYRGYSIHDLAENATFEEVCGLLLFGELPSRRRLSEIDAELKASRNIPAAVYALIASLKNAHPMEVLRQMVPNVRPIGGNGLAQVIGVHMYAHVFFHS